MVVIFNLYLQTCIRIIVKGYLTLYLWLINFLLLLKKCMSIHIKVQLPLPVGAVCCKPPLVPPHLPHFLPCRSWSLPTEHCLFLKELMTDRV